MKSDKFIEEFWKELHRREDNAEFYISDISDGIVNLNFKDGSICRFSVPKTFIKASIADKDGT